MLPDYYGAAADAKACELQAMKIDPAHRQGEADLVMSRWFDYSDLHPAKATYLYAHLYKEQTRKFCVAYIDIRTADNARGFVPDDIFLSRDATSMWLARRCADALGVPYEFALEFAQHRALDRHFQCFPRPNQLYGEEFEIDLANAWFESKGRMLRYSRMPRFHASNWRGSKVQRMHADFVIEQIMQRPAPRHNLLARMLREGVLPQPLIALHFAHEEVQRALEVASKLDAQS